MPTPADARGAIAVGAVDWRGDRLRGYSSHGPTPDGRLKPDLVAPTDTWLMGPLGRRGVGGTSNAAPNAAGAAALMLAAARAAGRPSDARTIRARLAALAYDLGPPGPDPAYGAGRVRATLTGPAVVDPRPTPGAWVRGVVMARVALRSPNQVTDWSLEVDGQTVMARPGARPGGLRIDTRRLGDGIHRLRRAP
ncbi:MAG TPA: S8 family serine peptidase, partial [Miltoncostaeaceae bacterium]|nr:S8 family serine peptidase [Miltoncostaeaceae bacterium]